MIGNYFKHLRQRNIQLNEVEVKELYNKHMTECKVDGLKDEYKDEYLYLSAIHAIYMELAKGRKAGIFPVIKIIDGKPYERYVSCHW